MLNNIIYWGDMGHRAYIYGSIIERNLDGSIHLKNNLLDPGLKIKEWVSKTNYQVDRVSPELPLLKRGVTYQITADFSAKPSDDNIYIQIVFYDRYDEVLSEFTIKNKNGIFTYPTEAYTYKIKLINVGSTEIYFRYFTIEEVVNKDTEHNLCPSLEISELLNIDNSSEILNILFIEPKSSLKTELDKAYLNGFDNLIYINSDYQDAKLFFDKDSFHLITEKIRNYRALGYEKFNFIGYDRVSNMAASLYALEISSAVAYVTNIFAKQGYYERISKYDEMKHIDFANIDKHKDNIIIYANAVYDFDIDLVSNFVDKSHLLIQCPIFKHR